MDGYLWFWGAVAVGVIFLWVALAKRQIKTFDQVVATVNREHGLAFPKDPLLGSTSSGLLFDRTNKKILFIGGSKYEILDYDYIVRWSLLWDETIGAKPKNCRILIETRDFDRPRMKFHVLFFKTGELWVSRLDVLLNRE